MIANELATRNETDFDLEPESTMISTHHRNSKKDMAGIFRGNYQGITDSVLKVFGI